MLLVALGTLMVTSVLYMLADSVVWLFVARGLQGLATGLALGAASAAMLDLHPRRDPSAVGLANGVLSAGGIGLGMLASATLVELAPAPRVLPYVLLFLLFAIAFAGTRALPEPVEERSRPRLTPQKPSVPVPVRRAFLLAALAVISSWSIGGLFFSLGPQLSAGLFDSTDHLVTALGVFLLAGAGSLAQLAFGRARPWVGAVTGVDRARGRDAADRRRGRARVARCCTSLGSLVGGAGFGVAFLGALRALSIVIPPDHRAAVMSAFYVVAYLSISVPAILAGLLITPLGLDTTFEIFGAVVAALALVVAGEAWRTRPRRRPCRRVGSAPAMRATDVVVVGGGIIGLAAADALARQGAAVVVLERGEPGAGQSAGAARGFRHLHATDAADRRRRRRPRRLGRVVGARRRAARGGGGRAAARRRRRGRRGAAARVRRPRRGPATPRATGIPRCDPTPARCCGTRAAGRSAPRARSRGCAAASTSAART